MGHLKGQIHPLVLLFYIHTPFFPAKRQFFPCDLFRIDSYLRSGFWFSVGPTVRSYTTNVPTQKCFFLFRWSGPEAPEVPAAKKRLDFPREISPRNFPANFPLEFSPRISPANFPREFSPRTIKERIGLTVSWLQSRCRWCAQLRRSSRRSGRGA